MSTPRRALIFTSVVLLVGASLCVLVDNQVTGIDLCGLVLLPAVGLVVMSPRPLVGRVVPILIPIHLVDPPAPPFPPPRT